MNTMTETTARTGKTIDQLIAEEAADRAAFEARETYKGFTVAELRAAFDKVQHPDNWKLPLNGIIRLDEVEKTAAAAEFFAASPIEVVYAEPVIEGHVRKCYVTGKGYYECCGA